MLEVPVADAIPELVAQGFIDLLGSVYETGISFAGRSMAVELERTGTPERETRYIDFICQAVRDADGEVTGIFCEGHDVTEQKLAAGQVQRLQSEVIHLARMSAMGTICATLAHELAQPLTAISNYADVCHRVGDDDAGRATLVDCLEGVRQSAKRANEIIRRLRNMTKRSGPECELFDLKDAVGETLQIAHLERCGTVLLNDRSGRVMLNADLVQIQQVMMNLVRNGCEAASMRQGGQVTISTSVSEDRVVVSVEDNGPGVLRAARASLFDWSDSTKPDGTGIGLSICRTIVDAHGGDIWLENSGSEGTCFRFSLPLAGASDSDRSNA
jgi:two-component system, LuxR family, sensor kinase FixL